MNVLWNNWDLYQKNKASDFKNNHFYLSDYKLSNIKFNIDKINISPTVKEKDLNFINNIKMYFPKIKINYLDNLSLDDFFLSKADGFIQNNQKIENISKIFLKNKIVSKEKNIFEAAFDIKSKPLFSKESRFSKDHWIYTQNKLKKEEGNVISLRKNNYKDIMCQVDPSVVIYDQKIDLSQELNVFPTLSFTPRSFLEKLKQDKYQEFYYNVDFSNSTLEKNIKWKFSEENKSVIYNMDIKEIDSNKDYLFKNNKETYFYEQQKVQNSFYVGKFLYLETDDFNHTEVIIKNENYFSFFKKVGYKNNLVKLELITL